MKEKKITSLTWGLFIDNKLNPLSYIKYIISVFKRIFFLLKNGYSKQANVYTYGYFIQIMKDIFTRYRYERNSNICIGNNEESYDSNNNDLYDKMISLLTTMDKVDEDSFVDIVQLTNSKKEFFELFEKYFWDFID